MQFFVGTSGFSYKEWRGSFYPDKLSPAKMLSYYAERFQTVEMNNSFYRMPAPSVVKAWANETSEKFRFVLKAPRSITHMKRLKNAEEATESFLTAAAELGSRKGPLLFQLPPNFKKDVSKLEAFLTLLKPNGASAFEFRHESWFDDEVFACLKKFSCALCLADTDEAPLTKVVSTASWGYVRLRSEGYSDAQLQTWIKRLRAQEWDTAYVFFKHEDTGTGPKLASRFLELAQE